jgi:hypothetical protein
VSQEAWIILGLKIAVIVGFISLAGWIAIYSALAPWWKNAIGRTLVAKTALIAALLVPTGLSLFLRFNRLTSYVAGWVDVALIGLISPVMIWRSLVFWKIHKMGNESAAEAETQTPNPLYCSVSVSAPAVLKTPPGRQTW